VPTPPGGGGDNVARLLAPKLSEILGQQIVIDNRGGAGGSIGALTAARAAPDGYTLMAAIASQVTDAAVMKNAAYDLQRDFAPVSLTVTLSNVLASHPSLPARSLSDLINLAKARPGQLQVASGSYGGSSHLAMEYFLSMSGLSMINVPYKGVGPALVDVIAGHVPLMMGSTLSALPHIRSGRLRAYGVTSVQRTSGAPGHPDDRRVRGSRAMPLTIGPGLLAPAGTPRAIIMQLHAAAVKALQDEGVRKRFADNGADATPSESPQAFSAFIRRRTREVDEGRQGRRHQTAVINSRGKPITIRKPVMARSKTSATRTTQQMHVSVLPDRMPPLPRAKMNAAQKKSSRRDDRRAARIPDGFVSTHPAQSRDS
jgi:tripartite-type tricarboxylate transporter receptor subunit TctC